MITASIGRVDVRFTARLPEAAQRIVRDLADEANELNVMSHALNNRREEIREVKGHAEGRIQELQHPSYKNHSGSAIEEQRKIIAECHADLLRLGERMADLNAKARVSSQLIESARVLVRNADRDKPITLHTGPQPQLRKNETALEAIEARRRRLSELSADFDRTKVAPKLAADVKAEAIATINALAKRGTPDVFNAIETGGEIIWPTTQMYLPDGMIATVFDALGFDCWVRKDAIIAGIEREIGLMADDASALSDSDREKALTQIQRDMLATEREDAHLTRQAIAQGIRITYRGETNPVALLGLAA